MKKWRTSTKIALGMAVLVVGSYFGYKVITDQMILNQQFAVLEPGTVNLVGVNKESGYRIIVANQMAQLVKTEGGFEATETGGEGPTSGAVRKRLPIREMMGTLQGDTKALGDFVMILNDMQEDESWPTVRVVWTKEDIEKAIAGDAALRQRLERDLNVRIDGTPMDSVRIDSIANGIVVDYPVTVKVNLRGEVVPMVARVQQPYKPRLIRDTEASYKDKNVDRFAIAGYYETRAREVLEDPTLKENVAKTLQGLFGPDVQKRLAETPEQVLSNAQVIITEGQIPKASYNTYDGPDGKLHDLKIDLTEEGRRRLWQYSKNRVGNQILLVADGLAIAAPRIRHELAQSELTITQMRDEVLLKDAVDAINQDAGKATAKR